MQLFYSEYFEKEIAYFTEEESLHCIKVLRKKKGDFIQVTDGKGGLYQATILDANLKSCTLQILEKLIENEKRDYSVHIALAPTKNIDRTEWFVEKTVEIGVDKISFLLCERSERKQINLERMQKLVLSAMKQSLKLFLPEIRGMTVFKDVLTQHEEENTQKWIACMEEENQKHLKNVAQKDNAHLLLIGPEGDFTKKEVDLAKEAGFVPVSLGKSRLRTETAGVVACHLLNLLYE